MKRKEREMIQSTEKKKEGWWSMKARNRLQSKGAGLINFESRIQPKNSITEDIDRIIASRFQKM
jgi:hypothetical protein